MTDIPAPPAVDEIRSIRFRDGLYSRAAAYGDTPAVDRPATWVVNHALEAFLERVDRDNARLDRPDGDDVVKLGELQVGTSADIGWQTLLVDGYPIPHVKVTKQEDGNFYLSLDDRFGFIAEGWGELWRFAWFLAQCMAVSAGYSSHGPNSRRMNPYGPAEDPEPVVVWPEGHEHVGHATVQVTLKFSMPAYGADGAEVPYPLDCPPTGHWHAEDTELVIDRAMTEVCATLRRFGASGDIEVSGPQYVRPFALRRLRPIPTEQTGIEPERLTTTEDHKGFSEERCVRCGWVMGHRPLNCQNDNTPHVFPSQITEPFPQPEFDLVEHELKP